ncbi:MAG: KOW motif-containing protein [Treponema sp.]|nr:KOW motif-containing protein [Treponema sp.]
MENQLKKTEFYCLYIKNGSEWNYVKEVQSVLDSPDTPCTGKLYCLGKQMRLKTGKEYIDTLFPSYVFWETDSLDGFSFLQKGKGFVKILPQNSEPKTLSAPDVELIQSFLKYGTVMPILRVTFDVNDKIKILEGPFKGQEGLVKAVNRRNKRVNFDVELMNGSSLIGLTYEIVKKVEEQE